MLDRSRDSTSDVQIRCNDFTCLTHLIRIWNISCIHRRAACTNSSTQRGCEFADQLESLLSAPDFSLFVVESCRWLQGWIVRDTAPARDDDSRVVQTHADFGDAVTFNDCLRIGLRFDLCNRSASACLLFRFREGTSAEGDEL